MKNTQMMLSHNPDHSSATILIVDDEPDTLEFLSYYLSKEGFQVHTAGDGAKALELAQKVQPDVVILDVMMPWPDGLEICRQIRQELRMENVLILFLTARGEETTEIVGFDVGADDYVTKPIRPRALVARIRALLNRKRNGDRESAVFSVGDLQIDREKRLVKKKDLVIQLPRKEYELLMVLISQPGKVFTREEIYEKVWGDVIVGERTLDVYITKLRRKIGDEYIKTLKGVGYSFQVPEE